MSTIVGTVGTDDKAKEVQNFLRAKNGRRIEPHSKRPILKYYHIFNVSPLKHTRALGGMGTFFIPECPEGAEYAEMTQKIPDFVEEYYEAGNQQLNHREWDGMDLAKDILGILPPTHADNDLTRYGVFVTENAVPTKAELDKARETLEANFQELCHEGDLMWSGEAEARQRIRDSRIHKIAARYIGHDADWCSVPKIKVPCPACGNPVPKGAAVHADPTCGAIIDEVKARKFLPHLFVDRKEAEEMPARKI